MERTPQDNQVVRINGTPARLKRWQDQEVLNALDSAVNRHYNAERDAERLIGEAVLRGLLPAESAAPSEPEEPQPDYVTANGAKVYLDMSEFHPSPEAA